jgi:hypothetical protein
MSISTPRFIASPSASYSAFHLVSQQVSPLAIPPTVSVVHILSAWSSKLRSLRRVQPNKDSARANEQPGPVISASILLLVPLSRSFFSFSFSSPLFRHALPIWKSWLSRPAASSQHIRGIAAVAFELDFEACLRTGESSGSGGRSM